jgi:hypothetical protein
MKYTPFCAEVQTAVGTKTLDFVANSTQLPYFQASGTRDESLAPRRQRRPRKSTAPLAATQAPAPRPVTRRAERGA